jgi:hypothetical protein
MHEVVIAQLFIDDDLAYALIPAYRQAGFGEGQG